MQIADVDRDKHVDTFLGPIHAIFGACRKIQVDIETDNLKLQAQNLTMLCNRDTHVK